MKGLTRNQWIAVTVGLVVVGVSYFTGQTLISMFGAPDVNGVSTNGTNMSDNAMNNDKMNANVSDAVVPPTGLGIKDVVVGTGAEAKSGNTVSVKYSGAFADGKVFDSTDLHGGQPFTFILGAGQVIKGWDLGVAGMKVGGKRTLTIPSDLGYGDAGYPGVIPPKATLTFQVELVGVK